jgi:hypothetical protein
VKESNRDRLATEAIMVGDRARSAAAMSDDDTSIEAAP